MEFTTETFAFTIARVSLGALLFFQAYDKIFRIGLKAVCDEVCEGTAKRGVPLWFSRFSVFASSYIELISGLMLLVGFMTIPALLISGTHLMIVVIAFSFLKGMWDMQHVFPRLALVILLLLLPEAWNVWSIDNFLS